MTATYNELIEAYPELTTSEPTEQATIKTLLTISDQQVVRKSFAHEDTWKQARLALAAHFVVLTIHRSLKHGGSGVGAVTGRTHKDGSSVSYGTVQGYLDEGVLLTTRYGVLYATLRRGSLARLPMVI